MRALVVACAAVVLIAAVLALEGSRSAWAQEGFDCEANDLGTLGGDAASAASKRTLDDRRLRLTLSHR